MVRPRDTSTAVTTDNVTSLTIKAPDLLAGDVLVAFLHKRDESPSFQPPPGWVQQLQAADQSAARLYTKVAGANEPPSYMWTFSTSGITLGAIVSVAGGDIHRVVDVKGAATAPTPDDTIVVPSVSPTRRHGLLLTFARSQDGTTFSQAGATELFDITSGTASSDRSSAGYYESLTGSGPTGTRTIVDENPHGHSAGKWSSYAIVIPPRVRKAMVV